VAGNGRNLSKTEQASWISQDEVSKPRSGSPPRGSASEGKFNGNNYVEVYDDRKATQNGSGMSVLR